MRAAGMRRARGSARAGMDNPGSRGRASQARCGMPRTMLPCAFACALLCPTLKAASAPPAITHAALGPTLTLQARNDGDQAWRCTVDFEWRPDDEPLTLPRAGSVQLLLPPRQQQRVVAASAGSRNLVLVGAPRTSCTPVS